jgi:hypothetical protein
MTKLTDWNKLHKEICKENNVEANYTNTKFSGCYSGDYSYCGLQGCDKSHSYIHLQDHIV